MMLQNQKPLEIASFCILFLSLFISATSKTPKTQNSFLRRGSSLSVGDDSDHLVSQDQTFTCGFHEVGDNAYGFSIWFTNYESEALVWSANRGRPVNSKGSRLSLRRDGAMVLTDVDGTAVWKTNTTGMIVERAELLNNGNLVIKSPNGNVLWQSFDSPTDTLLPHQLLTKDTKLRSERGIRTFSPGYFSLYFDSDNVLRMIYEGPDISSIYWPNPFGSLFENGRRISNSSRVAVLNEQGKFVSSDQYMFMAMDSFGFGIKRRLKLDHDGNLRLYSLNNGNWSISYQTMDDVCKIHGICGRNGICVHDRGPKCSCPPGYEVANSTDWNQGCKAKFKTTCSDKNELNPMKFVQLSYTDYYGIDIEFKTRVTLEECKALCAENCLCKGFNYRIDGQSMCWTKAELFNGFRSPTVVGSIYLKVPVAVDASEPVSLNVSKPLCPSKSVAVMMGFASMYENLHKGQKLTPILWFAVSIGVVEFMFVASSLCFLFNRQGFPDMLDNGYLAISSLFKRFTYFELKKATNKFREELGRGAFGDVYKGKLADEREVAVKRLGDVHHGEEGFWAEVSTIGKLNHMNLVRMWGYCYEGRHKLLVYEYIKNQSLDKHLFSGLVLGWKERFKIAVGTARGLAYLHHECLEWVFHCDMKPENILLDDDFEPKIADFGLAKLSERDSPNLESKLSMIRGTKGYMAPEWALNLPITSKVDVYSFGVVILEIVKGIRLSNWVVEEGKEKETELTRFVVMMKRKIQIQEDLGIEDMVDPRLEGRFSRNQVETMVRIGIACVEEDRSKRPTMSSVLQVLLESKDEALVKRKEHP